MARFEEDDAVLPEPVTAQAYAELANAARGVVQCHPTRMVLTTKGPLPKSSTGTKCAPSARASRVRILRARATSLWVAKAAPRCDRSDAQQLKEQTDQIDHAHRELGEKSVLVQQQACRTLSDGRPGI